MRAEGYEKHITFRAATKDVEKFKLKCRRKKLGKPATVLRTLIEAFNDGRLVITQPNEEDLSCHLNKK